MNLNNKHGASFIGYFQTNIVDNNKIGNNPHRMVNERNFNDKIVSGELQFPLFLYVKRK